MNANDHDRDHAKRLDEYIDALNAGRPAPQVADDADLADLFTTARDLHRLRAAEPVRDDVPSRLAAALERKLRANPKHGTRRIESNDMSQFRDASSDGSLRPPEDLRHDYAIPHRPERVRQWAQFAVAAVAFILIGVVLAQIIGSGSGDEPGGVGSGPSGSPTPQVSPTTTDGLMLPDDASILPPDFSTTVTATIAGPTATPDRSDAQATSSIAPVADPTWTSEATPTAPPIAPEFATLSVSPDYVTCESEVVARGTGFAPGTTVVIYGGPLFGDNFGPVSDDIPVAENGGFELVIDIGRIFAQCRGAEIDQEGSRYALGAETGSTLTKNDFEGPSAMTAITFSSTVPDALQDRPRLPSCGTEVIRTETDFTPQGESDVQARECFAAAVSAGSPAEFASYVQNSDFAIETTIYRVIDAGTVEILSDSTTRDRWEQYTCTGIMLPDAAPYQFQFETCGGTVAIE